VVTPRLIAQVQGSDQQHTVATIDMPIFATYPGEGDVAMEVSVKPEMRRSELAAGFRAVADAIEV